MKVLLLICLLVGSTDFVSAQIEKKDNSVKVIAYWKKGDKATYLVTREKSEVIGDKTSSLGKSNYKVNFEVLNETKSSYTIKWSYSDIKIPSDDELAKSMAKLMDGVSLVITTDEFGSFTGLENWKEISDKVMKAFDLIVKRYP